MLLGIDLGTSSVKAALIQQDGRCLAVKSESYAISTPQPGWAEQDPEAWVQAACRATKTALDAVGVRPKEVEALSFSGQMHGLVCLDEHGVVLRPAVIWADQRSFGEVQEVMAAVGRDRLAAWTGNPVDTGFMLPTWLWLRQYEPELAARTAHLLLPKDFVRYYLTGELATEPSDAGSTALFNPLLRQWSEHMLETFAIDPALLPPVVASGAIAGDLHAAGAAQLGLAAGTPVIAGGGDQACQALGNGILSSGDVSCTIGTGGQLLAPATVPIAEPGLRLHLYNHVHPGLWYHMGAILAAGLSLTWLRDAFFGSVTYQQMADWAVQAPACAEGLFFLPHLAGERTPHMDPFSRAAFVGLTVRHRREHIVRAVMEGVVFALRQAYDLLANLGVDARRIVASGGGAQHPLWLRLQADIFDRPIHRTATVEAAAVGAAMLAGIGIGLYRDAVDAVSQVVRWRDDVVFPDPTHVERYRCSYAIYQRLYPSLATTNPV